MKVHILTIGDELLIGQVVDTNSAWLGQQLNLIGGDVIGKSAIPDDRTAIERALQRASEEADVVLITGGLGPTKDDITKHALASFLGVPMEYDEATYKHIEAFFHNLGRIPSPSHKEQAVMPKGFTFLYNGAGTAPGMWFEKEGRILVSMPGVPHEMKYIMTHEVLERLHARFSTEAIVHRTLLTSGMGESIVSETLASFEESLPSHIKLAYLPRLGQVRLRLTAKGASEKLLEKEVDEKIETMKAILPENIVMGIGQGDMEHLIADMMLARQMTLGLAESCTGGLIASRLVALPGASSYFKGGVVAYDNQIKRSLLYVPQETITEHGAVSEETVLAMAKGALQRLHCDVAVAVSGIAGPDGGTPDKPVGTIWLAICSVETSYTQLIQAGRDRQRNIEYAANHALSMICRFIKKQYPMQHTQLVE